jgi:hypothetical protein
LVPGARRQLLTQVRTIPRRQDTPGSDRIVDVLLDDLEHTGYGGWGGRFVKEHGSKNTWCGAKDDGDIDMPLWRWSEAFQNDWAARADWCVRDYDEANHNPRVVVNGRPGKDIVRIEAKPGAPISSRIAE